MAGLIPAEFIEQVLARVDLVELVDKRIPLRKKSGSNFFACCPFHNENTPSFSVNQTKQIYYCFGCGVGGNAIDFFMRYDHMDFIEAIEALARHVGLEVPRTQQKSGTQPSSSGHPTLYALLEKVAQFYEAQLRKSERAIEYLKKRGISGQIAKQFGIGYVPNGWDLVLKTFGKTATDKQQLAEAGMLIKKDDGNYYDRFRDRIMFPIKDRRGRIIAFGGRIIDKGEPKYLNSPETPIFHKGHELYGLQQALQANRELKHVLIVEGYMDVIALAQHDITYAVATLGTATSAKHIERLARYTPEIIFCFDGDNAGRTAAWRALETTLPVLKDGMKVRFMFLPDGEDPDSLVRKEGKEAFEKRLPAADTLSHYFLHTLSQQADTTSMDGRARLVKLASDHINKLAPGIFQEMLIAELAKQARMDLQQLKQQLKPKRPGAAVETKMKPTVPQARTPSTIRLAITLLVQHPELIGDIPVPLPQLSLPGYELFAQLVELLKQRPHINHTGMILEHWRDEEKGQLLGKLANNEHMIADAAGLKADMAQVMQRLKQIENEQRIDQLLAKHAQQGLSQEERQLLIELQREVALTKRSGTIKT